MHRDAGTVAQRSEPPRSFAAVCSFAFKQLPFQQLPFQQLPFQQLPFQQLPFRGRAVQRLFSSAIGSSQSLRLPR
jgi:hypothetical protein